ncbi:hypothetical protein LTR37_001170 [Vermiconidia calcicola]|uniref:Uncharacterized protein n=1 Tax=Vermiconidia calcicola TaxID=1690605 RepID=A0ACC3NWA2_9PEZI|nr:hypothetical protein LTR37_001170 [Vermiconidia calcicola]
MGAKSPEEDRHNKGRDTSDFKPANPDSKHGKNGSQSADLDRGIIGGDDDDGDGDGERSGMTAEKQEKNKNKKRKKAKKSKKNESNDATKLQQMTPPRVLLSTLFASSEYPLGELIPYEKTRRTTDKEARYTSRLWDESFLADYRQAAEIHRQVRQYAQEKVIKPGASLAAIAEEIENGVRALCGHQGIQTGDALKAGMAFPTGLCLNNVGAHWTPNSHLPDVKLDKSDVLKVDFGVHVNGRIVDSAFTIAFDHTYDNLLTAVKEATNSGIAHAGVDARISEIGAAIQEVMESYEVEIAGKTLPIKAIRNITGHDILRYQIHGGKQIPFVRSNNRDKMEEGEVFAIETFGSTGKGYLRDDIGVYGYGRQADVSSANVQSSAAKTLLKTIDANFGTLVFCRRYLERLGTKHYHLGVKHLIDSGIVETYAPLVDVKGSYIAQFEHTILLHEGGKEVISRGNDY